MAPALVEDQAVEIVGDVGEREIRLGACQVNRADEEPEAGLLICEVVCPPSGPAVGMRVRQQRTDDAEEQVQ